MNTSKRMWLLRGVPGAGKTLIAKVLNDCLLGTSVSCSADDYFYRDGEYKFDPDKLYAAHRNCKEKVLKAMQQGVQNIILHNTNTTYKEFKAYLKLAHEYDYTVFSLVVENRHGNDSVHDLSQEKRLQMAEKIKNSLKLV